MDGLVVRHAHNYRSGVSKKKGHSTGLPVECHVWRFVRNSFSAQVSVRSPSERTFHYDVTW